MMWGGTLSRLATVTAVSLLATGALTAGACSSDTLRDQNYGTDLAQSYRYPDGGYPAPDSSRRRETAAAPDGEVDAEDAAPAAQDAGDAGTDGGDAADVGTRSDG